MHVSIHILDVQWHFYYSWDNGVALSAIVAVQATFYMPEMAERRQILAFLFHKKSRQCTFALVPLSPEL